MPDEIGLQELIDHVKEGLRKEAQDPSRLFFVERVELELHVDVKREASGGLKISVLQLAGLEAGGAATLERGHVIKLALLPLVTYEEARAELSRGEPGQLVTQERMAALTKEPPE